MAGSFIAVGATVLSTALGHDRAAMFLRDLADGIEAEVLAEHEAMNNPYTEKAWK